MTDRSILEIACAAGFVQPELREKRSPAQNWANLCEFSPMTASIRRHTMLLALEAIAYPLARAYHEQLGKNWQELRRNEPEKAEHAHMLMRKALGLAARTVDPPDAE